MKTSHINSISIKIFLFYTFSCLYSNVNSLNISSEEELKIDKQEILKTIKKSKIVACMSVVRNSLAEENKNVKIALDDSKFDRSKSLDKLIIAMIANCEKSITEQDMQQLLNPENILSPVSVNENYSHLIKFDKNILRDLEKIEYTVEEIYVLKEIDEAMEVEETDFAFQEEEVGNLGSKFSEFGKFYNIFIVIAVIMSVTILLAGLYVILCKKKIIKQKKNKIN
jgi:hypothetical protein